MCATNDSHLLPKAGISKGCMARRDGEKKRGCYLHRWKCYDGQCDIVNLETWCASESKQNPVNVKTGKMSCGKMGSSEAQNQAPNLLMIHMLRIDRKDIRSSECFHFTAISWQADEKSPWLQSRSTWGRARESHLVGINVLGRWQGFLKFIYLFN